jgi:hypothetical protein
MQTNECSYCMQTNEMRNTKERKAIYEQDNKNSWKKQRLSGYVTIILFQKTNPREIKMICPLKIWSWNYDRETSYTMTTRAYLM